MNTIENSLYERDFYAWVNHQALLLKQHNFKEVDFSNLIEELEALGRSEQRELRSRMLVLIMHLLKWFYQNENAGNSWKSTIREQRRKIARLLKDSPSLKKYCNDDDWLSDIWQEAIDDASFETSLDKAIFSSTPIWSVEQILDENFYPEPEKETLGE